MPPTKLPFILPPCMLPPEQTVSISYQELAAHIGSTNDPDATIYVAVKGLYIPPFEVTELL